MNNEKDAIGSFKPYKWQKRAFKMIDEAYKFIQNVIASIAAGVGSGKTAVAAYAFGRHILEADAMAGVDEIINTVSVFVAPQINLCKQQIEELKNYLFLMFDLEEGDGLDYKIYEVNCTCTDYNKLEKFINGHVIFVICDESLWGTNTDKKNPDARWDSWVSKFKTWEKNGVKLGCCFLDEFHNYSTKYKKITQLDVTI